MDLTIISIADNGPPTLSSPPLPPTLLAYFAATSLVCVPTKRLRARSQLLHPSYCMFISSTLPPHPCGSSFRSSACFDCLLTSSACFLFWPASSAWCQLPWRAHKPVAVPSYNGHPRAPPRRGITCLRKRHPRGCFLLPHGYPSFSLLKRGFHVRGYNQGPLPKAWSSLLACCRRLNLR